ncbi:hypothetical protein C8R47DRAFT_1222916 [Mycena vitilis]|nr:hypothetical protein C8R47DRAFT_1222916 [Mycena vitilis]
MENTVLTGSSNGLVTAVLAVDLQYDKQWCIVSEAKDNVVITAREFPKVHAKLNGRLAVHDTHKLITLSVSFPDDSGCEPFSLPLCPDQKRLDGWQRIEKIMMWHVPFDAYICEALPSPPSRSPSVILSSYFGRPVHLVYKGSQPRPCEPTPTHPKLDATAVFQDCFPVMVLSQESTMRVEEELRCHVGIQERWKTESLVIERFRPNIVFEGAGPFAEDSWEEIRLGAPDAPAISMVAKCTRCLVSEIGPHSRRSARLIWDETGVADKAVPYKTLMKFRRVDPENKMKACLENHGCPLGVGVVTMGDAVAGRRS